MLTMLAVLALLVLVGSLCVGFLRTIVFLGCILGLLGAALLVVLVARAVYTIAVLWLFCMLLKLFGKRK